MIKQKARSPPQPMASVKNQTFSTVLFPSIFLQNDGEKQSTRGLGSVAPQ